MADCFSQQPILLNSPATSAVAVTKSDSTILTQTSRALYVGSTGDVAVTMEGGDTVTFATVPAGAILPIRVTQVLSTGTSASNIVALS